MRYLLSLYTLALSLLVLAQACLILALAVSITTGGGGVDRPQDRPGGLWFGPRPAVPIPGPHWFSDYVGLDDVGLVVKRAVVAGAGDALAVYAWGVDEAAPTLAASAILGPSVPVIIAGPPGRLADLAVEAYGVGWAREILEEVEMCESSRQIQPCKVGAVGELGPFQFLPSTWATTPYALGDPCDRVTAWHAAGWMVSRGRGPSSWDYCWREAEGR